MNKNIWKNLEIKIGLMLLFVAASASIGIYRINYTHFYSLAMDDLKQDAINLHGYAEDAIDIRIFYEINTIEDQETELYINTHRLLDEIRRIGNAKFLYTVKLNDNNEYIYLIDGLDKDDENFVYAGMLVEDEYLADLDRNMNNEIVTSDGIMVTDYGYLYSMSFPFHDHEGNIIGVIGIDFDSEHLYHSMNRVRRMTIIFTLILGVFFTVTALFYIKRVVKHTEKIFNKMEIEKNEAYERTKILLDEIRKKAAQLETAKKAAEHNSQAKSIFLSQMSHEIRTPMNAILGIAEIRLRNNDLCEDVRNGFTKIYESGSLLLNIINDILDFSQIDAGKLEIINAQYSVPNMINHVVQMNRLRYDSKPIEFKLAIDENMPLELIGDELRIKQILNNLLSNAYKYTDSGVICFSVSVVVNEENGETVILVVKISDTGQGMSEKELNNLYGAYTRFNLDRNSGINGTGLGMNITKRLIGAMNGNINVESESGKGTVFFVHLPQKKCGLEVCGADVVEKLQTFTFNNELASKMAEITYEQIPEGKVLIVDDININLLIAQEMLQSYGLQIETADNGLEAVEKIKNGNHYDIVFMDHMMPVMDGIKATNLIREWEAEQCNNGNSLDKSMEFPSETPKLSGFARTPIVALTANAVLGQEEIFLTNGFDAFIAKPIDSHKLDQIVTRFIKNVKQLDESQLVNKTIDPLKMKKIFISDAENAINVLGKLSKEIKNLKGNDLESYIITVHGVKSALNGIGEKELSDLAYKLEQAGKNGNYDLMESDTPVLIDALSALNKNFQSRETEETGDVSHEVSSDASYDTSQEDIVFLNEKLDEIKISCENYDVKTAKKALADLKQKTWPLRITDICEEISVNLLCGEFKKVIITIEKYRAEIGGAQ